MTLTFPMVPMSPLLPGKMKDLHFCSQSSEQEEIFTTV